FPPSVDAARGSSRFDEFHGRTQSEGLTSNVTHRRPIMTETTTPLAETATHTLRVPGAELTYDIVRNEASAEPVLMLIGSPMCAAGLGTLAKHFSDRSVLTYDPRGAERSTKADPTTESTPEQHADDLHRIIGEVGGPV